MSLANAILYQIYVFSGGWKSFSAWSVSLEMV